MSDDIGPGDVVEAVKRMIGDRTNRPYVSVGQRAVVRSLLTTPPACRACKGEESYILEGISSNLLFCVCGWRKIGGSQADTIRRFAEDLNVRLPVREDA